MKEPVDHIERPRLPWRGLEGPNLTECGKLTGDVKTMTRTEFLAKLIEYGERRMALLTCMTCFETARRWGAWEENPCEVVLREIHRANRSPLLRHELRALALLARKHPIDFEGFLKDAALWEELRTKL